jgi:hypothetical protein
MKVKKEEAITAKHMSSGYFLRGGQAGRRAGGQLMKIVQGALLSRALYRYGEESFVVKTC